VVVVELGGKELPQLGLWLLAFAQGGDQLSCRLIGSRSGNRRPYAPCGIDQMLAVERLVCPGSCLLDDRIAQLGK